MKIGIMTFWWSNDNYGQLLQCYALQKYLRDRGHEPFLIRYECNDSSLSNPFWKRALHAFNPVYTVCFFLLLIKTYFLQREQKKHPRNFQTFRNLYFNFSKLSYSSIEELRKNPPVADAYIVGSDQVWNFSNGTLKQYRNYIHAMMLDFGQANKLSYAASWGMESLDSEFSREISPLLSKFDYVSVREDSGLTLCESCGRMDAERVIDPTLLLSTSEYRTLYKTVSVGDKPYLLLYMLNNGCSFNIQTVYEFAKKRDLNVFYITGNGIWNPHKKYYASIEEWLYLIDHAQYVVTNSYHCSIFCILFSKNFGVIPLTGRNSGMNTRFDTLFSVFSIEPRVISEKDFSVLDISFKTTPVMPSERFVSVLEKIEKLRKEK